jgi:hypothetical protein
MSLVDGAKEHVKQLANKVAERVNFNFAIVTSSTPSSGFHLTSAHIAALGSNRLSFRI